MYGLCDNCKCFKRVFKVRMCMRSKCVLGDDVKGCDKYEK